jgi:hypothetical protein
MAQFKRRRVKKATEATAGMTTDWSGKTVQVASAWGNSRPRRGLADIITGAFEGFHSAKGLQWGGIVTAGVAGTLNMGFWVSVLTGSTFVAVGLQLLDGNFASLIPFLFGIGICMTTSYAQGYSISSSKSVRNKLSQAIGSVFKPGVRHLPASADRQALASLSKTEKDFEALMSKLYWVSTVLEILAGLLVVGAVMGRGQETLAAMALFVFSVAGWQIGYYMMIAGRNVSMPASAQKAYKAVTARAENEGRKAFKV